MSNDKFNYTLEEQSTLLAQYTKMGTIINERQRPFNNVSPLLQAGIRGDDIVVVPRITVGDNGKLFHVTGNARTAVEAFDALGCEVRWGYAETPKKIPLIPGPVDENVRAIPLSELGDIRETGKLYEAYGSKIISPISVIYFGIKFPDEQRERALFTIWLDALGQFWYVILSRSGSKRSVNVSQDAPDARWGDGNCLLLRE